MKVSPRVPVLTQVDRCSLSASPSSPAFLTLTRKRTRIESPADSPRFLCALPTRLHPLCPSRGVARPELARSGALRRAAALLATLHQPLGLISVGTRLPSLPLRAPSATAHASNSTLQRAYDLPAQCRHADPHPPVTPCIFMGEKCWYLNLIVEKTTTIHFLNRYIPQYHWTSNFWPVIRSIRVCLCVCVGGGVMLMLIIDRVEGEGLRRNTSVQPWHPRLRCLPVFLGARLTPLNPVHPRPFSAGNTHSGHKTTSCFYPSVNNSWRGHKNVSDNAKDGVEKRKGIALSARPDICNHTWKLKLMMSWRL